MSYVKSTEIFPPTAPATEVYRSSEPRNACGLACPLRQGDHGFGSSAGDPEGVRKVCVCARARGPAGRCAEENAPGGIKLPGPVTRPVRP